MENIFKHNSRSYIDVYNAFIAAYPNKPTWVFKEMAGLFDFQSELMNRIASDILYPMTRESAYSFAAKCDYAPVEASGCTSLLTVTLTSSMNKTIAVGARFGGISTATGGMVLFEVATAKSVTGSDTMTALSVYQKTSYSSVELGVISGSDDYSEYPINGYTNIIASSMSLTINSQTWTKVSNFDLSGASDRHFMLIYQSSGKCRIRFGDGTNGLKPTTNNTIYGTFATTLGLLGRMALGEITINVDNDNDIKSVTNPAATSGGADSESVASIIRNARANIRLRNIIWSKEDLELAAVQTPTLSIIKALGVPGMGAATIHVIQSGGGTISGGDLTTVQTYVQTLTQFGVMPITVINADLVVTNITATVTVRSGFTAGIVQHLTEFALTLAAAATDSEVIEYYEENSMDASLLTMINSMQSAGPWSFTSTDYVDTNSEILVTDALGFIINKWIDLLGTRTSREWGQSLEIGDLWIMGNALYDYGVDVFSLTTPTSNVTCTSVQISDSGTVTVS